MERKEPKRSRASFENGIKDFPLRDSVNGVESPIRHNERGISDDRGTCCYDEEQCRYCGIPIAPGRTVCDPCLSDKAEYERDR